MRGVTSRGRQAIRKPCIKAKGSKTDFGNVNVLLEGAEFSCTEFTREYKKASTKQISVSRDLTWNVGARTGVKKAGSLQYTDWLTGRQKLAFMG